MNDPPLEPAIADLLVRVKLANRRQQLDKALHRMNQLEGPPHHHPEPQDRTTTDPTDKLRE